MYFSTCEGPTEKFADNGTVGLQAEGGHPTLLVIIVVIWPVVVVVVVVDRNIVSRAAVGRVAFADHRRHHHWHDSV